jgi:hypothetical protein
MKRNQMSMVQTGRSEASSEGTQNAADLVVETIPAGRNGEQQVHSHDLFTSAKFEP